MTYFGEGILSGDDLIYCCNLLLDGANMARRKVQPFS